MEEGKEVEKKKGEHTNAKRKKMRRVPKEGEFPKYECMEVSTVVVKTSNTAYIQKLGIPSNENL